MTLYEEIVTRARIGYLASLDGDQPRVRPMSFLYMPAGRLWSSTYAVSGKMKEFLRHAKVEVCFMDDRNYQLRVEGLIDTRGDREKKRRMLENHPPARNHFKDADDPRLVHIEIVPTRVRWKPAGFSEYEEIALDQDERPT